MAEDMERELFGTDSEDEDPPAVEPPRSSSVLGKRRTPEPESDGFRDIPVPVQPARLMRDDPEEPEDIEQEPGPSDDEQQPVGPPLTIEVPLHMPPPREALALMRLPKLVAIERAPFDPDHFEPHREVDAATGQARKATGSKATLVAQPQWLQLQQEAHRQPMQARPTFGNVVRWRERLRANGTVQRQSNARFVQWSDGSWQLFVGDEVLDVKEQDVSRDHSYLYVRHAAAGSSIQGQAQLTKRWTLQPASLKSKLHMQLAQAMEKQHTKTNKVKSTATISDPNKEKEERARDRERNIRSKDTLARRQEREMRKYSLASPGLRAARSQGITATFLEDTVEDDGELQGLTPSEAARGALARPRRDDAAEAEAARRLASAKQPGLAEGRSSKRPKVEASSNEELSDEDGAEAAAAGANEAGAERSSMLKARRAVVWSDDED